MRNLLIAAVLALPITAVAQTIPTPPTWPTGPTCHANPGTVTDNVCIKMLYTPLDGSASSYVYVPSTLLNPKFVESLPEVPAFEHSLVLAASATYVSNIDNFDGTGNYRLRGFDLASDLAITPVISIELEGQLNHDTVREDFGAAGARVQLPTHVITPFAKVLFGVDNLTDNRAPHTPYFGTDYDSLHPTLVYGVGLDAHVSGHWGARAQVEYASIFNFSRGVDASPLTYSAGVTYTLPHVHVAF